MEEKIEIWQVGNTGLRNPNRYKKDLKHLLIRHMWGIFEKKMKLIL